MWHKLVMMLLVVMVIVGETSCHGTSSGMQCRKGQ